VKHGERNAFAMDHVMLRKIMMVLAIALAFGGAMPATTAFARGRGGHMPGGMDVAHFDVGGLGTRARPPIPQQVLRQQAISPGPPPPSLQGPPSISAPFAGN
jgi:hypothetical protein